MASPRHVAVAAWLGVPAELLEDLRDEVLDAIVARMEGREAAIELQGRLAEAVENYRAQAQIDPLTGLLSRRAFDTALSEHLERRPQGVTVLVADLEDLHQVNQRFGFAAGDAALLEVAARLGTAVEPDEIMARASGTTFAILCPTTGEMDAAGRACRVAAAVNGEPLLLEQRSVPMHVRMGWTVARPGDSSEALIRGPLQRVVAG
ncbi:MAG: GGDEF domain-containing protein [Chloroflexi bacterium]|nr:MAG: GGDEF domain-containing protein [Chloroflexota bacterium]